jgi:hypothetical protein
MTTVTDTVGPLSETDFTELSLLLPSWQLLALDELAQRQGMSVGQLLRRLIGNMLHEMAHP